MTVRLAAGYIPLVDAAPLIMARALGFDEEEGLHLDLYPAPSWSALRDYLALGHVEAAHLLAPLPIATALGLGGSAQPLEVLSVLSLNGNVIGLSPTVADQVRRNGHGFAFNDAAAAGQALLQLDQPLRVGVPFPFSMHAELLFYWLDAIGLPPDRRPSIHTVPPPLMAEAMAKGEIDAFCVGEPWGSMSVEAGVGELLLPGQAIWRNAPEKVLATRRGWANNNPDIAGRLIRSLWRAGRWLGQAQNMTTCAEILSRPEHLGVSPDLIDRALSGRLVISARGEERQVSQFVAFFADSATVPWHSQAAWIGAQLAQRLGGDPIGAAEIAKGVFRSDLYRQHLEHIAHDLPNVSVPMPSSTSSDTDAMLGAIPNNVPGAVPDTAKAGTTEADNPTSDSPHGMNTANAPTDQQPDSFFDGRIFDLNPHKR